MADIFVSDADAGKGTAKIVLINCLGFTQKLERGEEIGRLLPVDLVEPEKTGKGVVSQVVTDEQNTPSVEEEEVKQRKEKLREALKPGLDGTPGEEQLSGLLEEYHEFFSLNKGDQEETDLIELHIDTGDATPRNNPVCQVPFAVRDEIAHNLQEMQDGNVIQPSNSL